MDHKEQHHLRHQKERDEKIKEQKLHERSEERRDNWPFHPIWLVVAGGVAVLIAILIWTLIPW